MAEFKLGYRTDSIVFSMKSLLLKVAYSIQSLIIGAGLQLSHYDGELVKQGISTARFRTECICVMMFLSAYFRSSFVVYFFKEI